MKTGTKVRVTHVSGPNTTWAKQYVDQIGIVQGRCFLYRHAYIVKFSNGFCSLYRHELEEVE